MNQWQYHTSADGVKELLTGGGEFVEPKEILRDLTEAQAVAVLPGSPYSIAQLVSHIQFYQVVALAKARGEEWPRPAHLDNTFAPVEAGTWPALVEECLACMEACGQAAAEFAEKTSPDRDDTSVCYDLAELALHNAYHFGEIVLLRRLQELWPPAGGEPYDF